MEKRVSRFWQRVNDYGNDETRDPFSHSGAYHRHFQGYAEQRVPRENGRGYRIKRVYIADFYRYAETDAVWRGKKILYAALFLAAAGAVILAGSRPAAVNHIPAVGVAQILAFLPMIWLLYQLVLQMTAPRRMTVGERDSASGGFRKAAFVCGLYLVAVAVMMPVEKAIAYGSIDGGDWAVIALTLLGSGLTLLLGFLEKGRKHERVPNENTAPEGANEIW